MSDPNAYNTGYGGGENYQWDEATQQYYDYNQQQYGGDGGGAAGDYNQYGGGGQYDQYGGGQYDQYGGGGGEYAGVEGADNYQYGEGESYLQFAAGGEEGGETAGYNQYGDTTAGGGGSDQQAYDYTQETGGGGVENTSVGGIGGNLGGGGMYDPSLYEGSILPQDTMFAMNYPMKHYDTRIHGLGKRLQKLATGVEETGTAGLTTKFHVPGDPRYSWGGLGGDGTAGGGGGGARGWGRRGTARGRSGGGGGGGTWSNCCGGGGGGGGGYDEEEGTAFGRFLSSSPAAANSWKWTKEGKLKLGCAQPIIPVPVLQEIRRRDRIIAIPQVDIVDAVQPRVYNQGVKHDIPRMQVQVNEKKIDIPKITYVERDVIVPLITGYTHKFVPKWEIREVPRPVVKYTGDQQTIEVEVPQVKFVDKIVEREVIVDTIKKKVNKVIEIPKYVEKVEYVWKPVEKLIYINKYVPKFDVSLDCPPPLIVPFPVQKVTEMPALMVRKDPGELEQRELDIHSPPGTVRVPDEYIKEYTKDGTGGGGGGGGGTGEREESKFFDICCTSRMCACCNQEQGRCTCNTESGGGGGGGGMRGFDGQPTTGGQYDIPPPFMGGTGDDGGNAFNNFNADYEKLKEQAVEGGKNITEQANATAENIQRNVREAL